MAGALSTLTRFGYMVHRRSEINSPRGTCWKEMFSSPSLVCNLQDIFCLHTELPDGH
jgi:hypothetical protein